MTAEEKMKCNWIPRKISESSIKHDSVRGKENILFCGWRRDMDDMIIILDDYVAPESTLTIMSTVSADERMSRLEEGDFRLDQLKNLSLIHVIGCPTLRRHLEKLPMTEYNSIVILANEDQGDDMQATDSSSLASLLLIRDIKNKLLNEESKQVGGLKRKLSITNGSMSTSTIISEILDGATRQLVSVASDESDFVMSNELISMSFVIADLIS